MKEACPYTIHKGNGRADTAESAPEGSEGSCVGHEVSRTSPYSLMPGNTTLGESRVVEASGQHKPWMVVTRKKASHKGTKHAPTSEGTTKSTWKLASHPLQEAWIDLSKGGPSLTQHDNAEV